MSTAGAGNGTSRLSDRALEILVERARAGETITYSAIAADLGINPQHPLLKVNLDKISRSEDKAGRGLLSVLVVRQSERSPGPGFFRLARELGREFEDDGQFFQEEIARVIAQWRGGQAADEDESSDEAEQADVPQEDSDYEPMDLDEDEEDDRLLEEEKASPIYRIAHGVVEAGGGVKDGAAHVSSRLAVQSRKLWKAARVPQRGRQAARSISGFIARRGRRGSGGDS